MLSKSEKPDSSISAWHFARWGLPIMTVSARHLHAQTLFWLQGSRNVKYESFSTWLINIDLWKRCQWWNIDKTTLRIRCDQFWFPKARSRDTRAHIFLGGELPWGARRRSPDSNQLSHYYTLWAHLTNLTLAHSPASRWTASLCITISALFQHLTHLTAHPSPDRKTQRHEYNTGIQNSRRWGASARTQHSCSCRMTEWEWERGRCARSMEKRKGKRLSFDRRRSFCLY